MRKHQSPFTRRRIEGIFEYEYRSILAQTVITVQVFERNKPMIVFFLLLFGRTLQHREVERVVSDNLGGTGDRVELDVV